MGPRRRYRLRHDTARRTRRGLHRGHRTAGGNAGGQRRLRFYGRRGSRRQRADSSPRHARPPRLAVARPPEIVGPATFPFDRSWDFEVPPERLWAAVTDTASFRQWWPWLRDFDPVPVEPGAHTHAVIGPPLP